MRAVDVLNTMRPGNTMENTKHYLQSLTEQDDPDYIYDVATTMLLKEPKEAQTGQHTSPKELMRPY